MNLRCSPVEVAEAATAQNGSLLLISFTEQAFMLSMFLLIFLGRRTLKTPRRFVFTSFVNLAVVVLSTHSTATEAPAERVELVLATRVG